MIEGVGQGSVLRWEGAGACKVISDAVAIEEPLEIHINNAPLVVTMRTPGEDAELAIGFLFGEGIIRRSEDLVAGDSACSKLAPDVLNVSLSPTLKVETNAAHRFGTISSSCGLCGKSAIQFLHREFPQIGHSTPVHVEVLLALPQSLSAAQRNFAHTGGIHAAGIFDLSGNALVIREDVGRHNAVDKAVGRAFLNGHLPLRDHILFVSGRTSLEIVQKAVAAGIAIVASVSAPTSLAINFARQAGQTLIGFLRPPTFNVYAHVERLALAAEK